MRTLIYKRTHTGDPDREGRFGIHGCMGQVRTWGFEAVIGIGGIGAEPTKCGLAGKVNWIGIGPHRRAGNDPRGPVVTFDHFLLFGPDDPDSSDGPSFSQLAPQLANRMYSTNVRVVMNDLDEWERSEVEQLLAMAKDAPPSATDVPSPATTAKGCMPRNPRPKRIRGCSC